MLQDPPFGSWVTFGELRAPRPPGRSAGRPHLSSFNVSSWMDSDLLARHCRPLPQGSAPFESDAAQSLLAQLSTRWSIVDDHHLEGRFEYADFLGALAFTNRAGGVAEAEGHHPEITVTWGSATVRIWTHSIDGLSENDFILAARIDSLA